MTNVTPRWEDAGTVAGFATGTPNEALVAFARGIAAARGRPRVLDLGCGAARNTIPIAACGCCAVGLDLSAPMLVAARERAVHAAPGADLRWVRAPMAPLPFRDGAFDLIVAHGVWNLARSDAEFRAAVREAARVARPGAGLFLFTFSRSTLAAQAAPVAGERLTFTEFAGEPQVFLTRDDVVGELAAAGFVEAPPVALRELNRGSPLSVAWTARRPAIWEGTFRRT